MSLAEAIGVPPDVEFQGQQCVRPAERNAANGVAGLDGTSKIPLSFISTVEPTQKAYRIPVTNANGELDQQLSSNVFKYSQYVNLYGSYQWLYGLRMIGFAYQYPGQENYIATDPESGLQTMLLPPGVFHIIVNITPMLFLASPPPSGKTRVDFWIAPPFMPWTLISPSFPDSIVDDAVYTLLDNTTHLAVGTRNHKLHYVVSSQSGSTWFKLYVGRMSSQPDDPAVVNAGGDVVIHIFRVG